MQVVPMRSRGELLYIEAGDSALASRFKQPCAQMATRGSSPSQRPLMAYILRYFGIDFGGLKPNRYMTVSDNISRH
jgi:hypothetical protein